MGPLRLGRQKLTRPGHTHISAYNPETQRGCGGLDMTTAPAPSVKGTGAVVSYHKTLVREDHAALGALTSSGRA